MTTDRVEEGSAATGSDEAAVAFLQWALPRMHLRWPGFRKVRRQVLRRIRARVAALRLDDLAAYRGFLEQNADEWSLLGGLCRVTISRFGRDRGIFASLRKHVLPELAARCADRPDPTLRVWSAGCASGEEPFSVVLAWKLAGRSLHPGVSLEVVATDVDATVLGRAGDGVYPPGSLRELSGEQVRAGFVRTPEGHRLRERFRLPVTFLRQDLRAEQPDGPFDLVLCRNLAFTYFAAPLQMRVLRAIAARLRIGGFLIVGIHERLPAGTPGFMEAEDFRCVWRRE